MRVFEYIFYRLSTSSVKVKAWDYHHPYLFGGEQISAFQAINILTVLIVIYRSFGLDWFGDNAKDVVFFGFFSLFICLLIINKLLFFTKEKFQKLEERWGNERKSVRIIKGWLIVLYCACSVVGFMYFSLR